MTKIKKILIIDDSALMRRILCDIIEKEQYYKVTDCVGDGLAALEVLEKKNFDCIFLDLHMPKMDGIAFLKELKKKGRREKIVVISSTSSKGEKITLEALALGAFDFIQKPQNILASKTGEFSGQIKNVLEAATYADTVSSGVPEKKPSNSFIKSEALTLEKHDGRKRIVAIASSTGGPNALQKLIPLLPHNLAAPVVIVQHMPVGFTKTLAERLNVNSEISVKEAEDGEKLLRGHVYIAKGGQHLNFQGSHGDGYLYYSDEPPREGVKPCANYLYESLAGSGYDEIVCVVMTGMGCDATEGITGLASKNKVHIIAQNQESCVVYGMPKSIVATGLVNQIVDLDHIAQEIIKKVGVR